MKLAIFSQIPDSASAFYRALFPFKTLSQSMNFTYEVIGGETITLPLNKLYEFDICFMMRPHDPGHTHLLRVMKNMGIPVWIDYDDDLFSIPYDHKEWDYFQSDSTHRSIIEACELSTVITVTTERIKAVLIEKKIAAEKIIVIPNAINNYLFPEPTPHNYSKSQSICWRGGFTHDRDLESIGPAVSMLLKKGYRFTFIGHKPHAIEKYLNGGFFSRVFEQDIFSYMQSLKRLNSPFHIIPLIDIRLNRAKSNLAYLEAAWIGGSVTLMPHWCAEKSSVSYNNIDELVQTMDSPAIGDMRHACYEASIAHIRENFLLSKVNDMRKDILGKFL